MVFQPDILPEILPSPPSSLDPIPDPPSHKISDPSPSLHRKDEQSVTCFKKKPKKRTNRPNFTRISKFKGRESAGVNAFGIVAAEPKKAFQCTYGNRDWLLNFTIIDLLEPSTKITVAYFAAKLADLPPIEHEDFILLMGASHKFHSKYGWQLQITRLLNTQWKVIKMKQPKSEEKGEGDEELHPLSHVQEEVSEKGVQDGQEEQGEQTKQENEQRNSNEQDTQKDEIRNEKDKQRDDQGGTQHNHGEQ